MTMISEKLKDGCIDLNSEMIISYVFLKVHIGF